jgi:hypothetical protein
MAAELWLATGAVDVAALFDAGFDVEDLGTCP